MASFRTGCTTYGQADSNDSISRRFRFRDRPDFLDSFCRQSPMDRSPGFSPQDEPSIVPGLKKMGTAFSLPRNSPRSRRPDFAREMMQLWTLCPALYAPLAIRCPATFEYFIKRETSFAAAAARIQPQVSMQHELVSGSSKTGRTDEHALCARCLKSGLRRPLPNSKATPREKKQSSMHIDYGDFLPTAARGIHGIAVAARHET